MHKHMIRTGCMEACDRGLNRGLEVFIQFVQVAGKRPRGLSLSWRN
jgi:hypothetical protein